jgi:hypothetical protein
MATSALVASCSRLFSSNLSGDLVMSSVPPKVFLSHASEDKDLFVLDFATQLRAKGIDVWVDRWEMLPGDSLIQKIFDEGLKNASAVIVVLSKNSVGKPWVKEELDNAAVKRINSGSKLIPVILDACEVPQVLQSTLWETVDLGDVGRVVDRVAAAIFNHRAKPPIGPAPVYSSSAYPSLPNLSATDTYILVESCRWTIDHDEPFVDPVKLFLESEAQALSRDVVNDSIDVLGEFGYLEVSRHLGRGPHGFRVTQSGLELYLSNLFPEYDAKVREAIALIVNKDVKTSRLLAREASVPHRVVCHIVSELEARGHVKVIRELNGIAQIYTTSAALKRMLAT